MDGFTPVYEQKAGFNKYYNDKNNDFTNGWSQTLLNKNEGKNRSSQWGYNSSNKFNERNYAGIKKKKHNSYFKNIPKKHVSSNMDFTSSSKLDFNKRTIVDIVDSDIEICYNETDDREIKRKKLNRNSNSVITDLDRSIKKKSKSPNCTEDDSDLFYFDISGSRQAEPSIVKHIYFGDENGTMIKTLNGNNDLIFHKKNATNILTKNNSSSNAVSEQSNNTNDNDSFSPSLMPKKKKRKKFSVDFNNRTSSEIDNNTCFNTVLNTKQGCGQQLNQTRETLNTFIPNVKESPKSNRKHFVEYKPSGNARWYNDSFIISDTSEKSELTNLKTSNDKRKVKLDITTNKCEGPTNLNDGNIYKFIQDMIKTDFVSNNTTSDTKSTMITGVSKLSDNSLIDILSEVTPNSAKNKKCASHNQKNTIEGETSVLNITNKKKENNTDSHNCINAKNNKNRFSKKKITENSGDDSLLKAENIKKFCTSTSKISDINSNVRCIGTDMDNEKKKNKKFKSSDDSILYTSDEIEFNKFDTSYERVRKKKKKIPKEVTLNEHNNVATSSAMGSRQKKRSNTPEVSEFSVNTDGEVNKGEDIENTCNELYVNDSEVLEKYKNTEDTYNKVHVDTSEVLNNYKDIYDISPRNSVKNKLKVDDVYSDEEYMCSLSNNESDSDDTVVRTKLDITEDLDEDTRAALSELNVILPFDEISPLHNIQRPSKPTSAETKIAKTLNARLGPFSKEEDEQIQTNWKNFCKDHNLSLQPSVFFKLHRFMGINQKIKFLQYISHKLDNRLPFSVHSRFRRIFGESYIKTGRFTKKEDQQIVDFMNKSNSRTPYHDLGILMGRSAQAIQRRVIILANSKYEDKIGWGLHLCQRLVEGIFTVTGLKNIKDLEHVTLNAEQWRRLSNILDRIPEKKLERAWMLTVHPRLFSNESNTTIKTDLIKMMLVNKERDFRTVNWKKYADNFSGVNDRKLYEFFINMMRQHVPKQKWSNLRSVVKHLSTITCRSRKFPRYIYENGKLEISVPL